MDLQEPLSPNEDQEHIKASRLMSQHPTLIKSRDQQSFSESVCHAIPQSLDESTSDGRKKKDGVDKLQKHHTVGHNLMPESQVKAKPWKIFITEKGDILHDNEAMEHIQASGKSGDTQSPDDSRDIFISPDGEIQRGEEATIAKAFHDIEKSCSRPNRSFAVTLKDPKVEENQPCAQHEDEVEADKHDRSPVESPCDHTEENENTHHELLRDTSPQIEDCNDDKGQNEEQSNSNGIVVNNNIMQSFEGSDSNIDDSSTSNKKEDQHACKKAEEDGNDFEDGYDTDGSDCHRKLAQNMSTTEETDNMTLDDDNEQYSDTEEDDHRSLQQQRSRVIIKVNEHKKSKTSSSKEVFEVKKTTALSEVSAASTDCKGVNEKVQCLTSDTNMRGGDVRVATAEAKLIDTKVQTGTVVTKVKGAELKLATSDVKGLHAQTGASLNVTTKASTITAGSVDVNGVDVDNQATTEPTAQGASIKTGCASLTGVQEKTKASVKVTTSGAKVQAGVADISVVKAGGTAEASVEAAGLDIKIGTAQVSAVELSATASASASTGTAVNIANARVTAFDGVGAHASINAHSGVDLFSVNVGTSGNTGVKVSTTTKVGCVTLAPGLPKLGFGSGFFNFGFGGGVEGQSGTYVGAATVGSSKGSSRHGNECGGNAGDNGFSSHEGGPGSSTEGNTSGISSDQGSSDAPSGCFSGSVGGMGNTASDSFSIGNNSSLYSGTNHSHQEHAMVHDNCIVPQSESNAHEDKFIKSGSFEGIKLDEQPLHLKVLQSLEYEHLGDKKDSAHLHNRQTMVDTGAIGQQLSTTEYNMQPQGAGARLQAKINEKYPSVLRGESKSAADKTMQQCSSVEHVKNLAIRRLNGEGKTGVHSPESSSTLSIKNSTNNTPPKKAKRFSHIHTLDDILMECPKGIVRINSGSGGNIAGFKDQDN